MTDLSVSIGSDHVAEVELRRPPNNFLDPTLLDELGTVYAALEDDRSCRSIVLCAEGKHFCAGADHGDADREVVSPEQLARSIERLFVTSKPIVAAVQGAAIGAGLGLACSADFRVASSAARFSANFARLGFHHGFGLTVTLPAVVGNQEALKLLYTGRRISGEEAARIGLCDVLVEDDEVRNAARALAVEIAGSAPAAVRAIRRTMRAPILAGIRAAVLHEAAEQEQQHRTADFVEGVRASAERRAPEFTGN